MSALRRNLMKIVNWKKLSHNEIHQIKIDGFKIFKLYMKDKPNN